ncbi:ETC complex I subunit [Commensalibacter nepenthis]|uniref:ETC complex I subunit n=1 Tax=Commensalibacter nepenthis TaxID=3043872 RepID=A0ABT6Q9Z1_9PROT|nr:ETC complex I subunit [Commensalibacter sp. TBRC 10068]MDI2113611.1 ETC complex I subunit [Commensalibacter sp. TBRC 10068]
MAKARIYRRAKKATQSGHAHHLWVLDYGQSSSRSHDPVTGWVGSNDTQVQVSISFQTKEQAIAYAERKSIDYDVEEPGSTRYTVKNYEDNFHNNRKMNWTH